MIADFKSIRRRIEDMQTNDEQRDDSIETMSRQRDGQRDDSIETMSSSDFSDEDSIEVVSASVDLLTVLGTEVVSLR